jgi:flagellar hook-associated protein 2
MPDNIYIPLNNKNNSSEAIKKIMDSKTVKLTQMEKEKDDFNAQKKAWSELKEKVISLQTKSKKLYNQEAPFDDKISQSTDEQAFKATVTKNADIGEHSLEIKSKAKNQRIASDPLNKDYKIPAGDYVFNVGKDKVSVSFSGGTIDDFVAAIKKNGKDVLGASATFDTKSTQVFIIEAKKLGAQNVISFGNDKTKEVFKKMNFYEDTVSYDKKFQINDKDLIDTSSEKQKPVFDSEGTLLIEPEKSYKFMNPEKIPYKDKLVMEVDLRVLSKDKIKESEEIIPNGPNFSKTGDVSIFGIDIEGESAIVNIPPFERKNKPAPALVEDAHYIDIVTNKRTIKLDELDVNDVKKTLRFDMNTIINRDETIEAVVFKNQNTYKRLEAGNLRFFDEASQNGIKYNNELSKAEDANLVFDGLKIKRSTNTIDDLLKGVTLNVYNQTHKEEKLRVDRDYEKIVKTIVDFLGDYNGVIDLVTAKTKIEVGDGKVSKKGEFSGEYGLSTLISKMRTIMMNQYPTDYSQELSMLSQIGISTNESTAHAMDAEKIFKGGILEVNENKFIEKMEKYPEGVKQLFGFDKSGDMIADSGIGFELESVLKLYTAKGEGFFDGKQQTLDMDIKRKDQDIEKYKITLKDEEQKLKEQFYKIEKASKDLEENSKKFDNFGK